MAGKKYGLMSRGEALRAIHAPQSADDLIQAKERLGFEELLVVMMAAGEPRANVVARRRTSNVLP